MVAATNNAKHVELTTLAPARCEAYSFLAAAFSEPPSCEQLDRIRNDTFLCDAAQLFGEPVLSLLGDYAAGRQTIAELQREAHQEYTNLFQVPGGQYVTPYESVYCDTREIAGQNVKGLLMGQPAVDVQKWYRLAALEIAEEYKDLPDHICLELNYLARLCRKEQEFAGVGDQAKLTRAWEMQRDFLAAHIVTWIGMLRDKIHEKSRNAYFRAVADMAVEFTQRDLVTLEDMLGRSQGRSVPEYDKLGS